jgi:glycosyltransferase involved in cell wall biosynthesis
MTDTPDKKTILFLSTTSGPGGAERMISTLSAALNAKQFRVIVGLFRQGWLQEQCESLQVETRIIPLEGVFHHRWFKRCLQLIREERVAVVHAHEFSAIVYGSLVARLTAIPFVGTIHGKNYYWERVRRRLAYRWASRYGQLVAVSEDLKKFVIEKVGIQDSRIQVIYNGVEPAATVQPEEVTRCREELGFGTDDIVIGAVGSLYPVKGHRYLLDAMPEVLAQHPRARLLIIGRGPLEDSLRAQADRLGIKDRVRFLGLRHDVPRLLAMMDLFVLPSLSEGLSLALLEAMAAGKPVVATRVGGNPELVKSGRTGLLVQPNDPVALATNISTLLSDPAKILEYGEHGRERVLACFGMDKMVDGYSRLYSTLTGCNGAGCEVQDPQNMSEVSSLVRRAS